MRKVMFAALSALLLLSSCIRKDDLEMLRSPMHISGEIDPQFGFPVASSNLLLADVIGLIPDASQYIDESVGSEFINFKFDTVLYTSLDYTSKKAKRQRSSKAITVIGDTLVYDSIFSGDQNFPLFEEGSTLEKIKFSSLYIDWSADLSLRVSDEFQNIDTNDVKAYLTDIKIEAVGSNDTRVTFPLNDIGTINIGQLIYSQNYHVNILDNYDLSTLAMQLSQMAPQKISYSAKIVMKVHNAYFATPQELIYDSLKIEGIDIVSDIHAKFPLNLSIEHLEYKVDTVSFSFGDKLDSIVTNLETQGASLEMKDAQVKLKIDNSLPFDVKLGAEVMDENLHGILTLLDTNSSSVLSAAPVIPSTENPNIYVSNGTSQSQLTIGITGEELKTLQQAKYIRFIIAVSTSTDGAGNYPYVAPRKSDQIAIKMFIKLHPSIEIDMPLNFGKPTNE